jgi:hypothetical protein
LINHKQMSKQESKLVKSENSNFSLIFSFFLEPTLDPGLFLTFGWLALNRIVTIFHTRFEL